ncbi:MAG: cation transporter [Leptospiraceae bacterium]
MDIQVEGMSCQHCVKSVTEAVHSVHSNARVNVSLDSGLVQIDNAEESQRDAIQSAIEEQGYEIKTLN